MLKENDVIENIYTKKKNTIVKIESICGKTVYELDDGNRFNSDYCCHYLRKNGERHGSKR